MDVRTLCDIFYRAVDGERKTAHLLRKVEGHWEPISSGAFREAVEEMSMGLRALGVKKGDRVAILSENRPEWAWADLATLTAAAADVPIYSTLPAPQVRYILQDSEAKVVFVSNDTQARKVAESRRRLKHLEHVVSFDPVRTAGVMPLEELRHTGREALRRQPEAVRKRAEGVKPSDLATLIYTSGTTGEPKGVMLLHRNLTSNVLAASKVFPVERDDLALSFLPLCHVFERMAGYYLILHGGATIAYAESVEKVPANMLEVRPTLMCSVPRLYEKMHARVLEKVASDPPLRQAIFRWAEGVGRQAFRHALDGTSPGPLLAAQQRLADLLVFSKVRERTGGRLRLFVSGGAPLAGEIAEFFGAAGLLILEGYGLTETSPVITVNRPGEMRPGTVGKPVEGVEVRIAEDGEILTRGPHVMKGYFNKPAATTEAIDSYGWFHTGDIGMFDKDGFLVITDRKKDIIVTSGGKNIAPQPIEGRLKSHELIAEAVMVGNRRNYPAALIVPDFAALEAWAKKQGVAAKGREQLVSRPAVVKLYEGIVKDLTDDLAQFEKIKKIALLPKELSVEAGELTPTLKVKRRVVEQNYAALIDRMYAGAGAAA